jgi:hypothetical protein
MGRGSRPYVTTGFNIFGGILNFSVVLRVVNLPVFLFRLDVFLFHLVGHDVLKIKSSTYN